MAVGFSTLVYLPNYDMFARPVTFTPVVSQPGSPAYAARGIYDTRALDVAAEDGSVFSDQQTILDIREAEFTVLPTQLDIVNIPADTNAGPALGDFEITDSSSNGGGETTLVIRKIKTPKP